MPDAMDRFPHFPAPSWALETDAIQYTIKRRVHVMVFSFFFCDPARDG